MFRFQISPTSFFQVNTLGAEKLYSIAKDWSTSNPNTYLLDVCCGTGTIGLIMSSTAKQVIGIEMVKSAVDDAHKNAELNKITNTDFICGKAEDVLQTAMNKYSLSTQPEVVAIVYVY